MKGLRPSDSDRWVNCTSSYYLELVYPDVQKKHSNQGKLAHEIAEWCLINNKHPDITPTTIKDKYDDCRYTKIMGKHISSYFNFVADHYPYTKLEVESIVNLEVLGIKNSDMIDCLIIKNNKLIIIDFKYGKWPVYINNNYQLLIYGYCALYKFIKHNITSVELVIFQPRVKHATCNISNNSNHSCSSSVVLSVDELKLAIEPVLNAISSIKNKNTMLNPGKWCMFCKAKNDCTVFYKGAIFNNNDNINDMFKDES